MLQEIKWIYEYRELLKSTIKKELRGRYKGSFLGFFWSFLNPLLMLVIYSIVFSIVLKVRVPHYNYALFLFTGLTPWTFFNLNIVQSTTIFIVNSNLIKKIHFPRLILPLATTLTNLINMLLTMVIVFVALWCSGVAPTALYLYLPVIILIETVLAFACSIILSSITIYLRDLEHIISVVLLAWFYMTPVIYPPNYVPTKFTLLFSLNPMVPIINSYRNVLLFNKPPDERLAGAAVFSILLLLGGNFLFSKLQKRFAEEL